MMARYLAVKILNHNYRSAKIDSNLIRNEISESNLSDLDRKLTWELVNGILKNIKLLDYIIEKYVSKIPKEEIKNVLRLGVYQMFFTRIPQYAAINESVNVIKKSKNKFAQKFVNGVLRNIQRDYDKIKNEIASDAISDDIKFSMPKWILDRFKDNYGIEKSYEILNVVARPPLLTVRVRKNILPFNEFLELLRKDEITFTEIGNGPWCIIHDKDIFWKKDYVKKKKCTVQDFSSGIACRLFNFASHKEPKVLDMCAAPGGKSLQILDELKGNGHLTANDLSKQRMPILSENLKLSEFDNYSFTNQDGELLRGEFSHILIDAPCTGLGTLRKRADLRWNRTQNDIHRMSSIQIKLLKNATRLLMDDGEIVYSTCSIDPDENENVIERFLLDNDEYRICEIDIDDINKYKTSQNSYLLFPEDQHDGAFAVKLIKSGRNK